jgi:hypothetical protein
MSPEVISLVKPLVEKAGYKGSRDLLFTVLLVGGGWLASSVQHETQSIKAGVVRIEAAQVQLETRIAALERTR